MTKAACPTTLPQLMALRVDDTFYTEGLFCGVADKQLKWTVLSTKSEEKVVAVVVRASYLGITLGEFVLSYMNKRMSLHAKAPATV